MAELRFPYVNTLNRSLGWIKEISSNSYLPQHNTDNTKNVESVEKESAESVLQKLFVLAEQLHTTNTKRSKERSRDIEVVVTDVEGKTRHVSVPEYKTSPAGLLKPEINLITIKITDASREATHHVTLRRWPKSGKMLVSYAELGFTGKFEQQHVRDKQGNKIEIMYPTEAEEFLPGFQQVEKILTEAVKKNENLLLDSKVALRRKSEDEVEFRETRIALQSERAARSTFSLAYQLYEQFLAEEGITSGPDIIKAATHAEDVVYQGKTYRVSIPKANVGIYYENQKEPQELQITLGQVDENGTLLKDKNHTLTFKNDVKDPVWSFSSSSGPGQVSLREAFNLDPDLKLAEQILYTVVNQTEKRLLETYPKRYKHKPEAEKSLSTSS